MIELLFLFIGVLFIIIGCLFLMVFGVVTCCWLFFDGDEVIDRIETDHELERLLK